MAIPQAALDDLRRRLSQTRWPDWSQGVPLATAQTLIAHWHDHYDWRKFEARLNSLPQFRTEIDGLSIHFIHVRSPHTEGLPIILTHDFQAWTDNQGKPEDALSVETMLDNISLYWLTDTAASSALEVIDFHHDGSPATIRKNSLAFGLLEEQFSFKCPSSFQR